MATYSQFSLRRRVTTFTISSMHMVGIDASTSRLQKERRALFANMSTITSFMMPSSRESSLVEKSKLSTLLTLITLFTSQRSRNYLSNSRISQSILKNTKSLRTLFLPNTKSCRKNGTTHTSETLFTLFGQTKKVLRNLLQTKEEKRPNKKHSIDLWFLNSYKNF